MRLFLWASFLVCFLLLFFFFGGGGGGGLNCLKLGISGVQIGRMGIY